MLSVRLVAAASLSSLLLGAIATGTPAGAGAASSPHSRDEGAGLRGEAAIERLADELPEIAARSGLSTRELRRVLANDDAARVASGGRLVYADTFPDASTSRAASTQAAPALPPAATFTLHSRPGSKHTIFLDFDGADVSDTYWNHVTGIPDGQYDGFSMDGDLSTFSADEHDYIQETWRILAEIFATFDVDVTTEDPGPAAYDRDGVADDTYGDHVVYSDDPDSRPICAGCAGVAVFGAFGDPSEEGTNSLEPVWVRRQANAFLAATVTAHEIGHTLGLNHDGVTTATTAQEREYYSGQGPWAPVMGSGLHGIVQFSNGDYANATNKQDDFATMVATGLPLLPDDAGNNAATATTLGARTNDSVRGTITSRDVDYYKVGPCAAAPSVEALGNGDGSALDLRVEVRRADNSLLAFSDPASGEAIPGGLAHRTATGMDAPRISPTGGAGTYYVTVRGVGNGNPLTTGYSDYGSVGTYTLAVDGCATSNGTAPDAPASIGLTTTKGSGTLTWSPPASGPAPTGYRISGIAGGPVEVPAGTTTRSITVPGGYDVNVSVVALNAAGAGAPATLNRHIASWVPVAAPALAVTTSGLKATIRWAPAANPGNAYLSYWLLSIDGRPAPQISPTRSYTTTFASYGTHTVTLAPEMEAELPGAAPARTLKVLVAVPPSAPRIGTASSGAAGGTVTATARWAAPVSSGGAAVTSYRVVAARIVGGKVVGTKVSGALPASARSYAFRLAKGSYRFRVVAANVKGSSPASAYSRTVVAR